MESENLNKNKNVIILLVLLLLISIVGNIVFFNQNTTIKTEEKLISEELDSVINAKVELAGELKTTSDELGKYKGISTKLDSLVLEANDKIKTQESKIVKLTKNAKNSNELITQLQEEIINLKKLKEEYLEKIDDLLVTNRELISQNSALNKTIKNLKEKVALGEQLIADNITIKPIKKNLFGKFTQTAMAKKTKKLEICFEILENKLIKAGQQKIFVRIMNPDGVTIFDEEVGSGQTNNPEYNVVMDYTLVADIDYKNAKFSDCAEWEGSNKYMEGTYIVILYSVKNKIGDTSFILK